MAPASKRGAHDQPTKQPKKGLTAHRWSVGFNETQGPIIEKLAKGIPVAIWIREAALEKAEAILGKPIPR